MTLTEFLSARIAEDEANIDGDWAGGDGGLHIISTPMHDRMVAECKTKRQIVRRHRPIPVGIPEITCHCCRANWPCPDVRTLVAVYADHPDYRQEWKP